MTKKNSYEQRREDLKKMIQRSKELANKSEELVGQTEELLRQIDESRSKKSPAKHGNT